MAKLTIQTNRDLLDKLTKLAERGLSEEEIEKQRVSFIFAGMPKNSGMSKLEIKKALKSA